MRRVKSEEGDISTPICIIVFFIIAATGAKRELNLVLVMGTVGLSVLREGMKISEIAKILQVHKSTSGLTNSREREEKCLFHKERKGRKRR
ncbi:hypothetical protein DDW09_04010 [Sulfolobus sp. SCGC AB-777_L09]|nr:hypothetical protein DDW09_04010 [Sulfolobus sp. SCGC AB-777_L09]